MKVETLHPTLWRTCRVLANDTRLRIFARLVRNQPQSVSQLAGAGALTLPVASQSLRALESRGLLLVRRVRRRVEYRIPSVAEAGNLADLIAALKTVLRHEPPAITEIIKLVTAFTHPSRIQIYRALASGQKMQIPIQTANPISARAQARHLGKLLARGYVELDEAGHCTVIQHPYALARALAALASA